MAARPSPNIASPPRLLFQPSVSGTARAHTEPSRVAKTGESLGEHGARDDRSGENSGSSLARRDLKGKRSSPRPVTEELLARCSCQNKTEMDNLYRLSRIRTRPLLKTSPVHAYSEKNVLVYWKSATSETQKRSVFDSSIYSTFMG